MADTTSLRLDDDLLKRAEALADRGDPRVFGGLARVTRAAVLRAALQRGLAELETAPRASGIADPYLRSKLREIVNEWHATLRERDQAVAVAARDAIGARMVGLLTDHVTERRGGAR